MRCHRACNKQKNKGRDKTTDYIRIASNTLSTIVDTTCFLSVLIRTPSKMVTIYFAILITFSILVSAEHSGAYSSPQYAKKMFPKGYDTNALLPREKITVNFRDDQETISRYDNNVNDTTEHPSFFNAAGSFLSSTGGQVVTSLAKDFIARSTGSSQVGFDCVSQVRTLHV